MKSGRVPGGPSPAQLPFTKRTYNLSQVAGRARPLLPFLINSLTLPVKGKSIPLVSLFLPLLQGGHCLTSADVFCRVPSSESCFFTAPAKSLLGLSPLCCPCLPPWALAWKHRERLRKSCAFPSTGWLGERALARGDGYILFLAYVTSSQLPTGYGTWLSFPSRLHDRAHNSSEGQGGAQEEEETLWKEE